MKKKLLPILATLLLLAIPAYAVFNEKDFARTLSILRSELHQESVKMEQMRAMLNADSEVQHQRLVDMTRRCNELALILYSQNQDYTFDLTYALEEVTKQYNDYTNQRTPFDEIVNRLNLEIERYEHLAEALRRLPPVLGKIDAVPDSLSAVMDTILVREATHHHEDGFDFVGNLHEKDSDHLIQQVTEYAQSADESFYLDEQSQADRDSCLAHTLELLSMYTEFRDRIVMDSDHYEGMKNRLEESYNYARKLYQIIQKRIFVEGQDDYLTVLRSFPRYARTAFRDARRKYAIGEDSLDSVSLRQSEWRGTLVSLFILYIIGYILLATLVSHLVIGLLRKRFACFQTEEFRLRKPLITLLCGVIIFALTTMIASLAIQHNFFRVAAGMLLVYAWLLAAILISLLIRVPATHIRQIAKLYLPVALLALIVITFRIIFIPNRLVNLIFPPILLGFTVWQYFLCLKVRHTEAARSDMVYGWISFGIMLITLVMVVIGYVLLGVQVLIWWLFQLAAIETITAFYILFDRYEQKHLSKRKLEYKKTHTIYEADKKESFIAVTWLSDFIKMALLPIAAILSVPMCIWLAADLFDLSEICRGIFYQTFFNLADKDGNEILHLSLYNIVLACVFFFLFRYLCYVLKAFYRRFRFVRFSQKEQKTFIRDNEINFTLADNVIGILVWGSYIIFLIILLKIPMGALSIVAAGLATGLGLAMKDILNNFIYGIQLMSGRLRVGDYIECDGIRGKVTSISYQTTQIQALDDTLIAFTNTTLFNKNFKNLTRSSAYEYVKVTVGVKYGTDVEKVRTLLLEAAQALQTKDKYGRNVVDPKRGISVSFDDFGDSSIEIALKQFVLVEEKYGYVARAKELIYNTLQENEIEIPFPQRDVHVK